MPEVTEVERPAPARPTPVGVLSGLVLVLVLILGFATLSAPILVSVVVAACAVILAWGWAGTVGLPSPRGTAGVLLVGGLALVISVAVPQEPPWLEWVPAALALAMIAAFVHQLLRVDGRPRVVQSVSSVVLALALVACGVLMIPASHSAEGVALLLGALAAAGASALTDLLRRWSSVGPWLMPLAMGAGGVAAILVALALDGSVAIWLLLGVASGALSHAMRAVLVGLPTLTHARPQLVAAVASVLVVGVVPQLVALAFLPGALTL